MAPTNSIKKIGVPTRFGDQTQTPTFTFAPSTSTSASSGTRTDNQLSHVKLSQQQTVVDTTDKSTNYNAPTTIIYNTVNHHHYGVHQASSDEVLQQRQQHGLPVTARETAPAVEDRRKIAARDDYEMDIDLLTAIEVADHYDARRDGDLVTAVEVTEGFDGDEDLVTAREPDPFLQLKLYDVVDLVCCDVWSTQGDKTFGKLIRHQENFHKRLFSLKEENVSARCTEHPCRSYVSRKSIVIHEAANWVRDEQKRPVPGGYTCRFLVTADYGIKQNTNNKRNTTSKVKLTRNKVKKIYPKKKSERKSAENRGKKV